jgi:chaperone modulatory protein CbpM
MTTQEHDALLLDDALIGLDELAGNCNVTHEWIIEHVRAGVLLDAADPDPSRWSFTSRDLLRARYLCTIERRFDANPELAGLVADLVEELERLRVRLRREGLELDE